MSVEGTVHDAHKNPHVAVKELLSAQGLKFEEFNEIVENEASVLTRFRRQQHSHLITAIASYSRPRLLAHPALSLLTYPPPFVRH